MATKTSASRRASGRGRSGSSRSGGGASSQQAVIIGAGAVVVILVLVFMMKGSGGGAADPKPAPAPAAQPKVAPPPAALPPLTSSSSSSSKRPLKPPLTPAPELTQAKLGELSQLIAKAKELHNAGVTARTGGDNETARGKEGEAKQLLEQWKASLQAQLDWQEHAQMEDWQQPAEYMALERIYGEWATLNKRVRMGGG